MRVVSKLAMIVLMDKETSRSLQEAFLHVTRREERTRTTVERSERTVGPVSVVSGEVNGNTAVPLKHFQKYAISKDARQRCVLYDLLTRHKRACGCGCFGIFEGLPSCRTQLHFDTFQEHPSQRLFPKHFVNFLQCRPPSTNALP